MISITTSQPVQWPVAPMAPQVAAVGGVPGVSAAGRDQAPGQQTGSRSDARAPRALAGPAERSDPQAGSASDNPAGAQAAPLLPRERAGKAMGAPGEAGRLAPERGEAAESDADAEARAQEAAERQPALLQEVLSSVWQASAAVVNVVLGRTSEAEAQNPAEPGQRAQGAQTAEGPHSEPAAPTPAQAAARRLEELLEQELAGGARGGQDLLAYTEQGTSAFAPLESGMLISERV